MTTIGPMFGLSIRKPTHLGAQGHVVYVYKKIEMKD